jgi:hypothetical protein
VADDTSRGGFSKFPQNGPEDDGAMKTRALSWLAWSLAVVTVFLLGFALVFSVRETPTFSPMRLQVPPWAMAVLELVFLAFSVVGALVAARHRTNAVGWLFLGIGLSGSITLAGISYVETTFPSREWAEWLAQWVSTAALTLIVFVLLLFPDGSLPSPRWRLVVWLHALATLMLVVGAFVPYTSQANLFPNPVGIEAMRGTILEDGQIGWILLPITMVAAAVCFVRRFRTSTGPRRQQLKWFSLAAAVVAAGYLILTTAWVASWFLPSHFKALAGIGAIVFFGSLMSVPIASGFAILRYRLYDIDLIINRTLVYGGLSAILGGTYIVIVAVAGTVLQGSNIVTAGATLAVAALFQPLRRRMQRFIDRRFYRRKYDASRVAEVFSAHLRDEVDLEAMRTRLQTAVQETMQPRQISIWLRGHR